MVADSAPPVLPEPVRARILALAADALGALPPDEVPTALRRVAHFTPRKRAASGGAAIAALLDADPLFRQRITAKALERHADLAGLAEAVRSGAVPAAADPADVAALAYLERPEHWADLLDVSAAALATAADLARSAAEAEAAARLRDDLETLRQTHRDELAAARAAADEVRAEADSLRRSLRRQEADAGRATSDARRTVAAAEDARDEAARRQEQAEAEVRRLRARVAELEEALAASRRAGREARGSGDVRLRLLTDTLAQAARGLQQELALPPVDELPGDRVAGELRGDASPQVAVPPGVAADDPALLDALLALPTAHLVVDGYNVTKTGYPELSLEQQRSRLLRGLGSLQSRTRAEVTCVFDGGKRGEERPLPVAARAPAGVRVIFSEIGVIADEVIRRLVAAEPPGRPVVVISSDREVADGVRRRGARPLPATVLLRRLERA